MNYKGLTKAREDQSTGAPITFHRIVQFVIDERSMTGGNESGNTTALLAGYVSEAKFDEGLNPMGSFSVSISGMPPAGVDAKVWIYQQITREAEQGGVAGPFVGGLLTPV